MLKYMYGKRNALFCTLKLTATFCYRMVAWWLTTLQPLLSTRPDYCGRRRVYSVLSPLERVGTNQPWKFSPPKSLSKTKSWKLSIAPRTRKVIFTFFGPLCGFFLMFDHLICDWTTLPRSAPPNPFQKLASGIERPLYDLWRLIYEDKFFQEIGYSLRSHSCTKYKYKIMG